MCILDWFGPGQAILSESLCRTPLAQNQVALLVLIPHWYKELALQVKQVYF